MQFVTPGAIGSGHIVVSDNVTYQEIVGFGDSLSKLTCPSFVQGPKLMVRTADSSARLLDDLKFRRVFLSAMTNPTIFISDKKFD